MFMDQKAETGKKVAGKENRVKVLDGYKEHSHVVGDGTLVTTRIPLHQLENVTDEPLHNQKDLETAKESPAWIHLQH